MCHANKAKMCYERKYFQKDASLGNESECHESSSVAIYI